jgi:TonB-dependent receptor
MFLGVAANLTPAQWIADRNFRPLPTMKLLPSRFVRWIGAFGIILAFQGVNAQSQNSGTVQGRVFNPATQEYVRNAEIRVEGTNLVAYSGDEGSYIIANVPAGSATMALTYTGYTAEPATIRVEPGKTTTRDFELKGSTFQKAGEAGKKEGVVVLGQFVVSSEREGNAKAIMEQRAALNMKNVVSSDNFGDVTGGNVGEFIKYLPGIVMDYVDADARAARIGGLDPKYAGVSIDGMRMASAASASFGGTTRQFEFEQASINSIEAIEVNKTLTASMDADSPAGTINMRSKNAFERKGREIIAQLSMSANTYAMTLHKTPGPDDGNHLKIFPGGTLSYADSFGGRFGVQLSLGSNTSWNQQAIWTTTFDYSLPARGPILTQIVLRDGPKIVRRDSIGVNLDFKITNNLVFALRTAASHLNDEFNTRTITFRANPGDIDPASTFTRVISRPTNNANTRIEQTISHRNKLNDTGTYTPKLEYKRGDLTVTAGGGYSRSRTHYEGPNSGFFAGYNNRLTRMSWQAERASTLDTGWNFTQLSGAPWNDIRSYNRVDANANNVNTSPQTGQSQVFAGNLDVKKTINLGLPVMFQTGWKTRLTTYDLAVTGNQQWTYVGAAGNQLDPSTVPLIERNYRFDPLQGGNYLSLGIPWPDTTKMWDLYLAHPEYFAPNTYQNFANTFTSPRGVKEQVDAGYVEGTTRWNKLRLNLGVRTERTRTIGRTYDIIPNAAVRAQRPDLTPNTIPYLLYQYRNGERSNKYGSYQNWFFSGGAKYAFTPKLHLLLAASQSISRPNYDNVAGTISINDTARRITLPNPDLKPETSDKYFVSAQYYLEPAGTISVSGYELQVKNLGISNVAISAEEAGYADEPDYVGYDFLRTSNAPGTRKIKGLDVEYSQQLVFLPGVWRGLSLFGSLSRTIPDLRVTSLVSKSANGGIRYSNHKFNLQLRCTWAAARLTSTNAQRDQWLNERIMFDLSGGYKFNRTYELTISGRNINNSPIRGYENEPGLLRMNEYLGPVWTLGLRGRF